jgi:hypothetical protein
MTRTVIRYVRQRQRGLLAPFIALNGTAYAVALLLAGAPAAASTIGIGARPHPGR